MPCSPEVHNRFGPRDSMYYFSALEGRGQNYDLNFRQSSIKTKKTIYLTSLLVACGLILLPSELFPILIICKTVNNRLVQLNSNSIIKSPSFRRSFLYFLTGVAITTYSK